MIDAKLFRTLRVVSGNYVAYKILGVWIPRRGDNLRSTVEVVGIYGANLVATLFEKDYDETGDGATSSVAATFNESTGRQTIELIGAKELVRFELGIEPASTLRDGEMGWVLLRFLQPVWFETVA